ncbi:MAG: hypothetical protein AB7K24_33700 [Gemmataceae bacterium]
MSTQPEPRNEAQQAKQPTNETKQPATVPLKRALQLKKPRPEMNPLQRLLDLSA